LDLHREGDALSNLLLLLLLLLLLSLQIFAWRQAELAA